jgi:hypothetical protein
MPLSSTHPTPPASPASAAPTPIADPAGCAACNAARGRLLIRLLALVWLTGGGWLAVCSLLENWQLLDPSYLGYFMWGTLLRPLCAMLIGVVLWRAAPRLGRRLAAD